MSYLGGGVSVSVAATSYLDEHLREVNKHFKSYYKKHLSPNLFITFSNNASLSISGYVDLRKISNPSIIYAREYKRNIFKSFRDLYYNKTLHKAALRNLRKASDIAHAVSIYAFQEAYLDEIYASLSFKNKNHKQILYNFQFSVSHEYEVEEICKANKEALEKFLTKEKLKELMQKDSKLKFELLANYSYPEFEDYYIELVGSLSFSFKLQAKELL